MTRIFSDVRFALRLLRRSPGFFATLLMVLVTGIGATTAMFSIVESLLLKPLPYPHPEELTALWSTQNDHGPTSLADAVDWRAQGTDFQKMAAIDYASFSLTTEGSIPEHFQGAYVMGDYFPMFGIPALRGRLLGPEDDHVGAPRVVVLSAAVWHRRFGSDPDLVGKTVLLSSDPFTVVGIAAEDFTFSGPGVDRSDIWVPLAVTAGYAKALTGERGNHSYHVMGRLNPGVTVAAAQTQMTSIADGLMQAYPDSNWKMGIRVEDLHDAMVGSAREGVWVLFAAMALVFLIVCANVANLLLTRAQSRRAEMAARAALGATQGRLVAQVVTETTVVFLIGAIGGAILSRWLVDLFASGIVDRGSAAGIPVHVDAIALLFCAIVCLVCGIVFGLVPALAVSRIEPQAVLKDSAARAGISKSQHAVRGALVVAQVALAFSLLAGAGLALKGFAKVASTSPGYDPENLASARVVLPETKYGDDAKVIAFFNALVERVAAEPGVTAVAGNGMLPLGGSSSSGTFKIEGAPPWQTGAGPSIERNVVTADYFRTMSIPVLRGRAFTEGDRQGAREVMILSQAAAEKFFPGEDPIGRRIDWEDTDDGKTVHMREIVGIVGDVRHRGPAKPVGVESYVPLGQYSNRYMVIVARSAHPDAVLQRLPDIVAALDPEQAVFSRRLMTDRIAIAIGPQRYITILLGAFAAAALVLATLGIFGLVSYATSQRTRELGIRMALGSTPAGVVRLVMKGGMRLLGMGLGVGLVGAVLVGRVLANRVVGVGAFDLVVYAAIPAILGISGMIACLVPAWRAVRIPPAIALRYE